MKKLLPLLLIQYIYILSFGQAPPEAFNYSSVIRGNNGQALPNKEIALRFSILSGSTSGNIEYQETHIDTTDKWGVVNLAIGRGTTTQGTFENIDWGSNTFYLQIELDDNGGSNFQMMGTVQFLSVPYAHYAKFAGNTISGDTSSTNELQTLSISNDTIFLTNGSFVKLPARIDGGKTHLFLFGNITNAEADSIIQAEVGPQTQIISVLNTTQLTQLNLPNLNSLVEVKISNNQSLTSVSIPDLNTYLGNLEISDNPNLSSVSIPNLTTAIDISIYGNALNSLDFSSIQYINNFDFIDLVIGNLNLSSLKYAKGTVDIGGNNISSLDLSGLDSAGRLDLGSGISSLLLPNFKNGDLLITFTDLSTINLPLLNRSSTVSLYRNDNLTSFSAPSLTLVEADIRFRENYSLTSIDISSLNQGSIVEIWDDTSLTSLNISSLIQCRYMLIDNTSMSNISLPSFTTQNLIISSDQIRIINNNNLTSISLPNINSDGNFYFNNNALTTTNVNALLNIFNSGAFSQDGGSSIYLQNQTPAAPPSGQGVTDKATLISNGNTVLTD